jgi:hypothetical protein
MIKMRNKKNRKKSNEEFQIVFTIFIVIIFYIAIIVAISALVIYMVCGYVTLEDAIIFPIIFVAVILVIAAWLGL